MSVDLGTAILVAGVLLTPWSAHNAANTIANTPLLSLLGGESPLQTSTMQRKYILMGVDLGAAILVAGVLLTWSVNNIAKTPLLSLRLRDNGIPAFASGSMLLQPGEVPRQRQGRGVLELETDDDDGDDTDTQDQVQEAPVPPQAVERAARAGAKLKLPKRGTANSKAFCRHG
ncbi:hypothetical protein JKP88DRAFT_311232 [Tribonema minus]|uniref:Uncharacterized protein n=1 Tax=Tribonema minus TaxID=303371 RepID=A0A836CGL0_9STRA|nr:hypothetical protein JKP88DRAFT_311232 [Tribonema minus]